MALLNTRLMAHPLNWLTVWMVLLLGGVMLDVIRQYHMQQTASS